MTVSMLNTPNLAWCVAALPWVMWAAERVRQARSLRRAAALAVVFALQALYGRARHRRGDRGRRACLRGRRAWSPQRRGSDQRAHAADRSVVGGCSASASAVSLRPDSSCRRSSPG